MKHVTVRGAQTVTSIHSVLPLAAMRHVFLHAKGHKGDYHPVIYFSKHFASIVAIRQWLWQALEKEWIPASSYPICVHLARNLGILLARAVIVHHVQVASQQPYVDMHCPAEKAHHLPVQEMTVAWD